MGRWNREIWLPARTWTSFQVRSYEPISITMYFSVATFIFIGGVYPYYPSFLEMWNYNMYTEKYIELILLKLSSSETEPY